MIRTQAQSHQQYVVTRHLNEERAHKERSREPIVKRDFVQDIGGELIGAGGDYIKPKVGHEVFKDREKDEDIEESNKAVISRSPLVLIPPFRLLETLRTHWNGRGSHDVRVSDKGSPVTRADATIPARAISNWTIHGQVR